MFERLKIILQKAKTLNGETLFTLAYNRNRKEMDFAIIKTNVLKQLIEDREQSDGKKMPKYSYSYESSFAFDYSDNAITRNKGEGYALVDTANFVNSFEVIFNGRIFVLEAETIKVLENGETTDLNVWNPVGISPKNYEYLLTEIIPNLQQALREWLLQQHT